MPEVKPVTVDGYTFTLASDAKVIRFTKDNKIEDVKLNDLYMKNIEFVAERGDVYTRQAPDLLSLSKPQEATQNIKLSEKLPPRS